MKKDILKRLTAAIWIIATVFTAHALDGASLQIPRWQPRDFSFTNRVVLHYRHVNQSERWRSSELTRAGDIYSAEIPGAYTTRRYALQYYFEVQTSATEATMIPPLAADLANVPYFIVSNFALKTAHKI